MVALQISKVHVFSYIPRLAEFMKKEFPKLEICSVTSEDNNTKCENAVTETELSKLQEATILITDTKLLAQIYRKLPNLLWAQVSYAGIETLASEVKKSSIKPSFPVTRCASLDQQMAEYTMAWIINHNRGFVQLKGLQKEKIWGSDTSIVASLKESVIGIAGVGEIGKAVAGYLKMFNGKVLGYGRSNTAPKDAHLDGYWYGHQLADFLAECDYIVNVLPSTEETIGIYGGNTLQSAKKKPVFINIGRGNAISNDDLLKALDNQWISTAILDVFTEEPLPQSSPLWDHSNVIITPHIAANSTQEHIVATFKLNMERITNNEPLKYLVDWDKGY